MTPRDRRLLLAAALVAGVSVAAAPAVAGDDPREVLGFDALHARLGPDAPTGAGIVGSYVEAPDGNGFWRPDLTIGELSGKSLTVESSGASGLSAHSSGVMRQLCGDTTSVAPGMTDIHLWEALDWLNDFLRAGSGGAIAPEPLPAPIRVLNNSWIGSANPSLDNDVLRRADLVIDRDRLLIASGMSNSPAGNPPLMGHLYNGLAVGTRDGGHGNLPTQSGIDGPGRMKPEIVGVAGTTSSATPQIAAVGAVLSETIETWPGLATNLNARRVQVLKAAILAGATKENQLTGTWTNGPETSGPDRGVTLTPLDDVMGVGTANVDRSHMVLTALEQNGTDDPDAASGLPSRGWDYDTIGVGQTRYWGIDVPEGADALAVVLTWNRTVRLSTNEWAVADLDLELLRREADGSLAPLTGDAGLGVFASGNVASRSPVDNIEHLYLEGLAPGSYVLRAERLDAGGSPPTNWPFAIAWLGPEPVAPGVPEDVNGDGTVSLDDLLIVLSAFGPCGDPCPADVDGDETVGFSDIVAVLAAWD